MPLNEDTLYGAPPSPYPLRQVCYKTFHSILRVTYDVLGVKAKQDECCLLAKIFSVGSSA